MELVLGAGGVKGYGHVGVLKSIEKHKIPISEVTGVSIGSLIAAFYCNGFSAEEIRQILAKEAFLKEGAQALERWQDALTPLAVQHAGLINLGPIMQELVRKYDLKPNRRLKIVAYNVKTFSPVLFSGSKYNLGLAIAGSCSVPLVMRPIIDRIRHNSQQKEICVDGFLHHTHPSQFCKGPAIVSKLGFASRLPSEFLPAPEMLLHLLELANSMFLDWYFEDPDSQHILVESGLPDVASLSFSVSERKCREMVRHAEHSANSQFKLAKAQGKLS